jgi:hypothetical protein
LISKVFVAVPHLPEVPLAIATNVSHLSDCALELLNQSKFLLLHVEMQNLKA